MGMMKAPKQKMHHIRVMPAKGGVVVSEHASPHDSEPMSKPRVFGMDEGDELAEHLLKRAGVPGAAEERGEEEHKHLKEPVEMEE
jgi:hypothetical protein